MTCGFKPAAMGAEEKYSGTIGESSKDLPSEKLSWCGPFWGLTEGKVRAGILAQRYMKAVRAPGARGRNQSRHRSAIRDE
jgi:hypothetical protein